MVSPSAIRLTPTVLISIGPLLGSAWTVCEAWSEAEGGAGEGLAGGEVAQEDESEVFVGGSAEAVEDGASGGADGVPCDEVPRAVEDCGEVGSPEESALDDGVDGFEQVGGVELQGAGYEQGGLGYVGVGAGEVEDGAV